MVQGCVGRTVGGSGKGSVAGVSERAEGDEFVGIFVFVHVLRYILSGY